ncbi:unnamed protein product [Paramecium sonneborni]|uniref:Uncharacterized protein n=1 Tax=Paramecium sonneborni TaxID=65129 RepID=A0A8S1KTR8_9CILI|nr:unnamed protein product [Paramecium sonneborni]
MSIGAFIKSKVSLVISGQQYKPDNYHHVRFMVLKEEKYGFLQNLKVAIFFDEKHMYLGQNPSWKILDIDKRFQKQYPEFF